MRSNSGLTVATTAHTAALNAPPNTITAIIVAITRLPVCCEVRLPEFSQELRRTIAL